MQSEMAYGDSPVLTSFVGASAAPRPGTRAQPAEHADSVCRAERRGSGLFGGWLTLCGFPFNGREFGLRAASSSVMSSASPTQETSSGIRKWLSVRMARNFARIGIEVWSRALS